jgi:hypothetical protein
VNETDKTAGPLLRPRIRFLVLLLVIAFFPACAQLPEFARPQMTHPDGGQGAILEGLNYRDLTITDFRAASLPEKMAAHSGKINAHAAIQIRLTPDSSFKIFQGDLNGEIYYFGKIDRLGFEAVLVPERSWWNPGIAPAMRAYVLQHEQIHFALTEIAARRLTRESQQWASELLVIRQTPQQVQAELVRQVKEKMTAAMEASLKEQAEFDQDTSLFYNPRRQQWWFWTVTDELKM